MEQQASSSSGNSQSTDSSVVVEAEFWDQPIIVPFEPSWNNVALLMFDWRAATASDGEECFRFLLLDTILAQCEPATALPIAEWFDTFRAGGDPLVGRRAFPYLVDVRMSGHLVCHMLSPFLICRTDTQSVNLRLLNQQVASTYCSLRRLCKNSEKATEWAYLRLLDLFPLGFVGLDDPYVTMTGPTYQTGGYGKLFTSLDVPAQAWPLTPTEFHAPPVDVNKFMVVLAEYLGPPPANASPFEQYVRNAAVNVLKMWLHLSTKLAKVEEMFTRCESLLAGLEARAAELHTQVRMLRFSAEQLLADAEQ